MRRGIVFFLSGAPGSGKTTVARALMQRYPRGFHLPLDDFREWVVSGIAHPVPWSDETGRQFELAFQSGAEISRIYANAGFAVAVDQVLYPEQIQKYFLARLDGVRCYPILLTPPEAVARERNRARTSKAFDPSVLEPVIAGIAASLSAAVNGQPEWITIDNGGLSVEETVNAVLRGIRESDRPPTTERPAEIADSKPY
jgi:predicted kinase